MIDSYDYGDGKNYIMNEIIYLYIEKKSAVEILNSIYKYIEGEGLTWIVNDVGKWKLKIVNEGNKVFNYKGYLIKGEKELVEISKVIRLKLNRPDLLVFDGAAKDDRIDRIMIEYHRKRLADANNESIYSYNKTITLDRFIEKLIYTKQDDLVHTINEYYIKDKISNLLDKHISQKLIHRLEEPKYAIKESLETVDYKITVDYLVKGQLSLSGSFDKDGLPQDFPAIAEDIEELINLNSYNEMLNPARYKRVRRKKVNIFSVA